MPKKEHLHAERGLNAYAVQYRQGASEYAAATLKTGLVVKCSFSDILGESGTRRRLLAQAIHAASERRNKPFVAVNCAALPETLLESELFGYEGGAFSGARRGGKPGLFELAHLGRVFLDEVAEMPIGLQARLLRVLQSWT